MLNICVDLVGGRTEILSICRDFIGGTAQIGTQHILLALPLPYFSVPLPNWNPKLSTEDRDVPALAKSRYQYLNEWQDFGK